MAKLRCCAAIGLVVLAGACARQRSGVRAAREYEGVTLARIAELPDPGGSPGEASGFERACAMRLRDPRNGQELLLVHSEIATPRMTDGTTTTTHLASAIGDYAPLPANGGGAAPGPRLRVDCVRGTALGWVPGGG
jgi:hypothetical protein